MGMRIRTPAGLVQQARLSPTAFSFGLLLILQVTILAALPEERATASGWLRLMQARLEIAFKSQYDPKRGSYVKLPSLRSQRPQWTRDSRGFGLVAVSTCEACNAKTVVQWAHVLRKRGTRYIFVVAPTTPHRLSAQQVEQACGALGIDADIIVDSTGQTQNLLNAYFAPRCYRFGPEGRLDWLQQPGEAILN